LPAGQKFSKITQNRPKKESDWPGKLANHRQLLRYEKNGFESTFDTKKKHILKNN
jgi:hypothetical protein